MPQISAGQYTKVVGFIPENKLLCSCPLWQFTKEGLVNKWFVGVRLIPLPRILNLLWHCSHFVLGPNCGFCHCFEYKTVNCEP